MKIRQENFHFSCQNSAHKNSCHQNVKVINSTLSQKSLACFYPCRYQLSVSKNITIALPFFSPKAGVQPKGSRGLTVQKKVMKCAKHS